MRLNSALTFIFLFVSAALSGPLREKDQSWVPNLVKKSTNGTPKYAGAYWGETDGNFTFATATFNVVPAQQNYTVWVAIGDPSTQSDISWLAAGINTIVTDNTWCYLENSDVYYSNVTITPNDVIRTSITARSATSGAVIIENINNSQTDVSYLLVDATHSLVGAEVRWGVELSFNDSEPIPFDTLTITNVTAYGPSGKNYEAEGATKMEIEQDDKVVISVETKNSTITIQHVHE
ncbi:peptidase A4 family-domain-containing protein [Boletus edulis BED1]|uniref:Peptidase A4 family-domain-containing protein n=1 Tax=Boletus edulis BED1 TaxID=1328754 RepID=A0AAD4BYH4_BOLED|nr:peptidase A4 family-domain-containing protein [Boletus edulis BED1]